MPTFGTPSAVALAPLTKSSRRTQSGYRGAIERLCKEHGDKRVATLQREHVVRLLAARAEKPEAANRLRKALRAFGETRRR